MSAALDVRQVMERVGSDAPRAELRRRLADAVESMIAVLDALDGDPDEEPSLGWTKTMAWGSTDDREEDAVSITSD